MTLRNSITFNTALDIYTATEIIGEGGSSRVYKVKDASGETAAIKLLHSNKLSTEILKRFKNEILFCIRNKHPNIITIIDHGNMLNNNKNVPFCVMPFYQSSLRQLIQTGIKPEKVLLYFSQILDGIEAAHLLKVIHRDVKPENILYNKDKNVFVITDFGIAHFTEEELFTAVKTADTKRLANFQYAAPEQKERGKLVDYRADIFALGLILNEMFTNQVPQGTSYKTIGSVSKDYAYLDDLVNDMIRQSPEERPASIEVIKRELVRRGSEFVTSQKISQLSNTVISSTEIDDLLIKDPVKLIGIDWKDRVLTLILNHPVNPLWTNAFYNIGNFSFMLGKEPKAFKFTIDKSFIPAEEREVQKIVDLFKTWLPKANQLYKQNLEDNQKRIEEDKRQLIILEKIRQEERLRILKNTQI